MSDDTRWLTYAEAARQLGVDEDSIKRRAQRRGWPRMLGNDGRALVAIPADILEGDTSTRQSPPGDTGGDTSSLVSSLVDDLRQARAERDAAKEGEAAALRRLAAVEAALAVSTSYAPGSVRQRIARRLRVLLARTRTP